MVLICIQGCHQGVLNDGLLIQNCLRADVSVKITRNEFNKWITVNSNVYKCTITILCSVFHLLVICLQYSSEITLFLKLFLWSFYVFNDKTMFLNQFLAVLDVVHNTRTATPIVQLQSSKSAWFIRIKSHGLDLGKADFKNFLWFIPSLFVKGRYIEARTVQKPDALTFINTPWTQRQIFIIFLPRSGSVHYLDLPPISYDSLWNIGLQCLCHYICFCGKHHTITDSGLDPIGSATQENSKK